jgi:hypothetical protein
MSCASSNLANQDPNYYQNVNGYAVPSSIPYDRNTPNGLRKYKGGYPPFAPTIDSLSVTSSGAGTYSLVYISGANFLPRLFLKTSCSDIRRKLFHAHFEWGMGYL